MRKSRLSFFFFTLWAGIAFKAGGPPSLYIFPDLKFFPPMPMRESDPVTNEGVTLGRYLFYDDILSSDRSMSCATCHRQKAAFSDAPQRFSKGRNDELMQRNTMPLFNLSWYPGFFWDGKAATLEEQIFFPVRAHNEMNLRWKDAVQRVESSEFYKSEFKQAFGNRKIDSILVSNAIGQFLRTLLSYRSKYDRVLIGESRFTKDELDGYILMNDQTKGDCLHCHSTDADALGTMRFYSNNGLDSVSDKKNYKDPGRGGITGLSRDYGKFKIPSLRNLLFTAPYMHDGRFNTIEEVIDFYSEGIRPTVNIDSRMEFAHRGGAKLSSDEKNKIVAFLKTLTDSLFVADKEFSNPFKNKIDLD